MEIKIPALSLVVLVGASGSGKSTFAGKHFKPTEVLSSDFFRGLVSDVENDQEATKDAFDALHFIAGKRLSNGKLTVIDATNIQSEARRPLLALADTHNVLPIAIVLNLPEAVCREQSRKNPLRNISPRVIGKHCHEVRRSLKQLKREGFRHINVLSSQEELSEVTITRAPLWNDLRQETGPFDIIGDVHGCFDELCALLEKLGYEVSVQKTDSEPPQFKVLAPEGRKTVFLGDLVDRGPNTPDVLRLVMSMVEAGTALCVPGNHDIRLVRKLRGKNIKITHGLAESIDQLEKEGDDFSLKATEFLDGLISHYVLDDGKLVVAHAGLKEHMQGRASKRVREFALFGEVTGEVDEFDLPIRNDWAREYRGKAMVVYGHTPVPEPLCVNRTINIDTGCVFGEKLTALKYPERELVSVLANKAYAQPARPIASGDDTSRADERRDDDMLNLEDVLGRRHIQTRLKNTVIIRKENALAALEVMSRYAVDPKWLIYLPPTMSPTETSKEAGHLEHPSQAFAYFKKHGISQVLCEEKHMGSRAVLIVCRDENAAAKRFGSVGTAGGICYTRTGRPFFGRNELEAELILRVRTTLEVSGFFKDFNTDWVCLDCELMPWSLKAQELIREQYAAVGAASKAALAQAVFALESASGNQIDVEDLLAKFRDRQSVTRLFTDVYRRYCWPVESVADIKIAPFHLLATEGAVHTNKDHPWHMEAILTLCQADRNKHNGAAILYPTSYRSIDLNNEESIEEGINWWKALTDSGGEGMVVKPLSFIPRGHGGAVQPAIKCRGREYLRLIYGPEYTVPEHLERLRERGLSSKRSLALKEFALGIEALERFVRAEPLYRVHECVFGVLALESEPVDPRL